MQYSPIELFSLSTKTVERRRDRVSESSRVVKSPTAFTGLDHTHTRRDWLYPRPPPPPLLLLLLPTSSSSSSSLMMQLAALIERIRLPFLPRLLGLSLVPLLYFPFFTRKRKEIARIPWFGLVQLSLPAEAVSTFSRLLNARWKVIWHTK